jgi:lysophospholipid acyltransferase (LPLAT)-like uncharacterized protein
VTGKKPRLLDRPAVHNFIGRHVLGAYIDLGMRTARVNYDPPDYEQRVLANVPVIYTFWHANMTAIGYMVPRADYANCRVMVSPHTDGRLGAAAIARWGGKVIYGTGNSFEGARAVGGTLEAIRAIQAGHSIVMTADVPPVRGRKVSKGLVRLARLAGCLVQPVAMASSRRTIFAKVWDQTQLNHPFAKATVVGAEPLRVDDNVSDEEAAAILKDRLDRAYERALQITAR